MEQLSPSERVFWRFNVKTKKGILGKLALLFVAVAWGSSMVVIKGSTDYLPAGTLLAMRFTIASIALAIVNNKKLKQLNMQEKTKYHFWEFV